MFFCGITPDDATNCVATRGGNHQSFACPVTTFIFGCSDALIYDPEVKKEDSFQPLDNIFKIHLIRYNVTD